MTCSLEYVPQLRVRGLRVTSQRMAILHVLRHSAGHLPPRKVYALASRALPGLTLPTVYRTLELLVRAGIVWQARLGNGHIAYELAAGKHDHLVCRECGDQIKVPEGLLKSSYRNLEMSSGYVLTGSHQTLSGLCPKCQQKRGAR